MRANLWGMFSNRVFEDGKEMIEYECQITRDHKEPMSLTEYLQFLAEDGYSYEIYEMTKIGEKIFPKRKRKDQNS